MPARLELIEQLQRDPLLLLPTRIEGYLLVALGVKPVSLITLPGELPQGDAWGWRIDQHYRGQLQRLAEAGWPARLKFRLCHLGQRPVTWKMNAARLAYRQVVERSPEYQAHLRWAEACGLHTLLWEVRPTVRELYLWQRQSAGDELQKLLVERERIKQELLTSVTRDTPVSFLIYPEEQSPAYLARLGHLLGYPDCCIQAYQRERAAGINVETRAARQLQQTPPAEPWAYFVKNFFPCCPDCAEASQLGRQAQQLLTAASPELGEAYRQLLQQNQELIRHYPELINRRLQSVAGAAASRPS